MEVEALFTTVFVTDKTSFGYFRNLVGQQEKKRADFDQCLSYERTAAVALRANTHTVINIID